jgi:hypothetical protein
MKKTITLYRAADDIGSYACGACFSPDRETAEAYLDNPGFGGDKVLTTRVDVDTERVLSLVDGYYNGLPYGRQSKRAWRDLADALGLDADDNDVIEALIDEGETYVHGVIDSRKRRAQLHAAGYDWVVYQDSYPDGAITWVYLGAPVRV